MLRRCSGEGSVGRGAVVGEPGQFLDGLAVDVELVGVEVDAGQFVVVSHGLEVDLVLAVSEAAHLAHARTVLLQRSLPHRLQPLLLLPLRLLPQLRNRLAGSGLRQHAVLKHAADLHSGLGVVFLPIPVLLSLIEQSLVDVVGCGQPSFSLVEAVLEVANVLFGGLFDIELASLAAIGELSLVFDFIVDGKLHPQPVLEAIQELSEVDPGVVEVEKAFVGLVLGNGEAVVDAVLELLDGGRPHHNVAAQAEVGEEGEDLGGLGLLHDLLPPAVFDHQVLADVADALARNGLGLHRWLVLYQLTHYLARLLVDLR
jgi:hypothetical protein